MDLDRRRFVYATIGFQFVHALFQVWLLGSVGWRWTSPASLAGVGSAAVVAVAAVAVLRSPVDRSESRERSETRFDASDGRIGSERRTPPSARYVADGGVSIDEATDYLRSSRDAARRINEGELDARLPEDRRGEFGQLSREINAFLDEVQQTLGVGREFSENISDSSRQITDSTEVVKEAAEAVAEDVEWIADVFREQHEQVTEVSNEMSRMSAMTEEIASSSDQVYERAERTEQQAAEGSDAGRRAADAKAEAKRRVEAVVEDVHDLDDQMDEIGTVTEIIDDIADQTQLLALNASIQAARAEGEGSAGFEVIVEEIKTLADETKDATSDIEELIGEGQTQTSEMVEEVTELQRTIDTVADAVTESLEAFESIEEHVGRTKADVEEISEATNEQASAVEEVAAVADTVADVSQENVGEAEHVAAVAEEQALTLGEMYVNSQTLSMRAEQIQSLLETDGAGNQRQSEAA